MYMISMGDTKKNHSSIASALELLQSCAKASICHHCSGLLHWYRGKDRIAPVPVNYIRQQSVDKYPRRHMASLIRDELMRTATQLLTLITVAQ